LLNTLATIWNTKPEKENDMVNPEIVELRQQQNAQDRKIAELGGIVQQVSKTLSDISRQSTLQIAAIIITLCLTMAGGLYFQTATLNQRNDQIDKRLDSIERRMDRIERSLDELNKELRAQRQASTRSAKKSVSQASNAPAAGPSSPTAR
jgi:chaperonin cofactor prefoldin